LITLANLALVLTGHYGIIQIKLRDNDMLLEIGLSIGTLATMYLLSMGNVSIGNIIGLAVTVLWIIFDLVFGLFTMLIMLHIPIILIHISAIWKGTRNEIS